jgi:tektin-4
MEKAASWNIKIDFRDDMLCTTCVYAQKGAPCYLTAELQDKFPPPEAMTAEGQESQKMGMSGPWATGHIDWGPLVGMSGTRPVVDKYSIARYSEGEWRRHNTDILGRADNEIHHAKV